MQTVERHLLISVSATYLPFQKRRKLEHIPATERASMLGHSVETNLKYYSFERKDSIDDICSLLDRQNQEVSPGSKQNVISFPKTKTPEAL